MASAFFFVLCRLPIGKYVKMAACPVLTVNHVAEIMINYVQMRSAEKDPCKCWQLVLQAVVPQRKRLEQQQQPTKKQKKQSDDAQTPREQSDHKADDSNGEGATN